MKKYTEHHLQYQLDQLLDAVNAYIDTEDDEDWQLDFEELAHTTINMTVLCNQLISNIQANPASIEKCKTTQLKQIQALPAHTYQEKNRKAILTLQATIKDAEFYLQLAQMKQVIAMKILPFTIIICLMGILCSPSDSRLSPNHFNGS